MVRCARLSTTIAVSKYVMIGSLPYRSITLDAIDRRATFSQRICLSRGKPRRPVHWRCHRDSSSESLCADGLCSSFPSLGDIFADLESKPLIEPGNATAIGQGHGHIV